jgi:hypothetical protein
MIEERIKCAKTNPHRAVYCIIVNNSTYGALVVGFSAYPSYSSSCAACVIAGGRWAFTVLIISCRIIKGGKPIYGDTDSCFVEFIPKLNHTTTRTLNEEHMDQVSVIYRRVLLKILSYTPLCSLRVDEVVDSGAPRIGVKGLYYGSMMIEGLASVRRSG